MSFKTNLTSLLRQITGVSTPIGGVNWNPRPDERQIVYELIQRLNDRRLIRHYHGGFEYIAVIRSCETMRSHLTETLIKLSPDSKVRPRLEAIRTALHLFQTLVEEKFPPEFESQSREPGAYDILTALYVVRDFIAEHLIQISRAYQIPLGDNIIDGLDLDRKQLLD